MAVLYVTEFNNIGGGARFPVAGALWAAVAEQTVAIGGVTASSAAFNANTLFIRVHTDVICSIDIGAAPTATTSTARMAANQTEYFSVKPGHKIAVIANL